MGLAVLIGSLFTLLFIGAPVILAMGTSALLYFVFAPGKLVLLPMYTEQFYGGMNSFLFLCMPLFIMAGEIMQRNRMIIELVDFAQFLVGRFRGGLAYMNVLVSMLFGGITGMALADISALGSAEVEAMKKDGYPGAFSAALTATSAIQGPIIPPSLPMVILASVTDASLGALFLAGAIPGALVGLGQMVVIALSAKRRGFPKHETIFYWKSFFKVTLTSFSSLMMPLIIVGGIVSGIFTPAESAAIAVGYAFFISYTVALKKAKLNLRDLRMIFANTARTSAQLYLIVGFAMLIGWIFAIESVPRLLSDFLTAHDLSFYLILFLINIFLLIVGCFISDVVQIVLFAPILGPMLVSMGMHPVHFGVMMVVNVVMGMITPPYGTGLYLVSAITGEKLTHIAKETVPFICSSIIVLFIVTYCPKIVLFLPRLTGFIK